MNPVLIFFAALLLFSAAKKKTSGMNVTVDFTEAGPECVVTITDSLGVATTFNKADGLIQTKQVATNSGTLSFTQLELDPGYITYVVDPNDADVGVGNNASIPVANFSNLYTVITQSR